MQRYLAFDLETAKVLPPDVRNVLKHRPLGISCAASIADNMPEPLLWYGKDEKNQPSKKMTHREAEQVVFKLTELTHQGYTLITWGGVDFDFNILAEESGLQKECAQLVLNHIDMLFHIVCSLGHRMSLQKASEGMNLPGKKIGISGALAPALWADGKYEEVLDYCVQDARLTLQIARKCEQMRQLQWMTQRNTIGIMPLQSGWLTVQQALSLPLPDTSWMSDPPSRESIVKWIYDAGCL